MSQHTKRYLQTTLAQGNTSAIVSTIIHSTKTEESPFQEISDVPVERNRVKQAQVFDVILNGFHLAYLLLTLPVLFGESLIRYLARREFIISEKFSKKGGQFLQFITRFRYIALLSFKTKEIYYPETTCLNRCTNLLIPVLTAYSMICSWKRGTFALNLWEQGFETFSMSEIFDMLASIGLSASCTGQDFITIIVRKICSGQDLPLKLLTYLNTAIENHGKNKTRHLMQLHRANSIISNQNRKKNDIAKLLQSTRISSNGTRNILKNGKKY